jgi:hypothetical protein
VHAVYLKWVVCLSFSPYFSANLEEEKEKNANLNSRFRIYIKF